VTAVLNLILLIAVMLVAAVLAGVAAVGVWSTAPRHKTRPPR
jgi:hypothetical protein